MDEQELVHKISVETNINVELLKDLIRDEKFLSLIRNKKVNDAIMYLRNNYPNMDLQKAVASARAFAEKISEI